MTNIRELARVALVNRVKLLNEIPKFDIAWMNSSNINLATQVNPFLSVELLYHDGQQIDLGTKPNYRLIGSISLNAFVKHGSGTKNANDMLSYFYPSIHMTDLIPPLRTQAARFVTHPKDTNGWVIESAIIPFWIDSIN